MPEKKLSNTEASDWAAVMLKIRIIPVLLAHGRELVKGKRFDSWRRLGNTLQAARVHNMRQVDELMILNTDGMFEIDDVKALCADTFMPVAIGGGVRSLKDFAVLLNAGADKIVINTAAVEAPRLITQAAKKFGSQAVVVSIDVDSQRRVKIKNGKCVTPKSPCTWAWEAAELGAGEILLTSIDREGTMKGYDINLITAVAASVTIPVVAHGGCGTYHHMVEALHAGAHAVAAGAMFLFTEQTPKGAAEYLATRGFPVRLAA